MCIGISKVYSSLLLLTVAGASLVVLTGCTTHGTVYISHPQVFTRERLVAAREKELQFLNTSLNAQVQSTFSAAQDVRTLSAFQDSLGVTVSPTAGASVPSASAPQLSDLSKMQLASPDSLVLAKNLSVSAVDQFKDEMAYRDAVNAVIREKELDDMHDRDGKTLYTLKFDTALIPGDDVHQSALVKIKIEGPNTNDIPEVYRLWLQNLEARRDEDERAIASRFYRGQITAADESLLTYLKRGLDDITMSATKRFTNDLDILRANLAWLNQAAQLTVKVMTMSPQCRLKEVNRIMHLCPQ